MAFVADIFDGVLDQLLQMVIVLHCRFNVADGVDNGGVVTAAEFRADRLQGHLGDLTDHIDRHLAGSGDLAGAFAAANVLRRNAVHVSHFQNDLLHGDRSRLVVAENVLDA